MPYIGSEKHTFTVCFVPDCATYHIEGRGCERASMIDGSVWAINASPRVWFSGATLTYANKLAFAGASASATRRHRCP